MDDRIMTGDTQDQPYGGTCPACQRTYRRAITFTGDGVIRGEIRGDICLTPEYLFAHSEIELTDPDEEFPTRKIGAMGNRKEVPIDKTDISEVWVSDAPDDPESAFRDGEE